MLTPQQWQRIKQWLDRNVPLDQRPALTEALLSGPLEECWVFEDRAIEGGYVVEGVPRDSILPIRLTKVYKSKRTALKKLKEALALGICRSVRREHHPRLASWLASKKT